MQGSTPEDIKKYKAHQNLYNGLKRKLRSNYYKTKCQTYKMNVKKLWALINNTITKVKHQGSIIPCITVNGIKQTKPKEIANAFGNFYSQLGADLAKNITDGKKHNDDYVSKIPRQLQSTVLKPTTTPEIKKFISDLPNKHSYGHDEISKIFTSLSIMPCLQPITK